MLKAMRKRLRSHSRMRAQSLGNGKTLLLVDQVVCSGSNAVAVLVASVFLQTEALNAYVLLQLLATTAIGFQRSILLDPSLVVTSKSNVGIAYGRWLAAFLLTPGVALLAGSALGLWTFYWPFVFLAISFPLIQDCFRYKSFALGRYIRALLSDGLWLLCLLIGAFVVHPTSVWEMIALWGGGAALALVPLVYRSPKRKEKVLSPALDLGKYQVTEWAVASFTTVVPMLLVQWLVPLASVSAFRLAQTFMGPLNTITSYVSVRYLLQSSLISRSSVGQMHRVVARTSRGLMLVAFTYGIAVVIAFYCLRNYVDPVLVDQLVYAVPVTVLAAVIASPCTPYLGLTRALSRHSSTILPRIQVLGTNVLAIILGISLWFATNLDPLVVTALITAAGSFVAYRRLFRRTIAFVSENL
ncbi:hypothetical protein QYM41_05165 [Kocuria sp. CPCC 205268]|uniref:hypothetical protein n=1 Tax=Kocuria oxytropis TaxID=3058913 RepID=UPI0034D77DCF